MLAQITAVCRESGETADFEIDRIQYRKQCAVLAKQQQRSERISTYDSTKAIARGGNP